MYAPLIQRNHAYLGGNIGLLSPSDLVMSIQTPLCSEYSPDGVHRILDPHTSRHVSPKEQCRAKEAQKRVLKNTTYPKDTSATATSLSQPLPRHPGARATLSDNLTRDDRHGPPMGILSGFSCFSLVRYLQSASDIPSTTNWHCCRPSATYRTRTPHQAVSVQLVKFWFLPRNNAHVQNPSANAFL